MEVKKLYWFIHPSKIGLVSSAKVHDLVKTELINNNAKPSKYEDYSITLDEERLSFLKEKGLRVEIYDGV